MVNLIGLIGMHSLNMSALTNLFHYNMSQRKQTLKGKDNSGTPTKVAHHSPSKQPIRSPLIASKFNASNSKPNVSYGELQIVLQNIQQIRKKANLQIALLTADNQKLKEELTRSHQDFEELNNRLNRSVSKNDYEIKIIEQLETAQNDKRQLQAEIKRKEKQNNQLQSRIAQLIQQVSEKDDKIIDTQSKVEQWGTKWKWAFEILAGDASRSQQLIWRVKNQCDSGIWSIFQQNSTLSQQLQLKTGRLQVLERELSEIKQTSRHTATLLEKSMAQVSVLNSKLSQCEQELAHLRQKCLLAENQLNSCSKDFKLRQLEYQNTIQSLQLKLADISKQKQVGFHDFTIKVARLQEEVHQRELALLQKQKHSEYEHLISEVCEQSQDYVQMLERLRYLQKFKAEHYSNVEKIQYLCKMLDY